MDQILFWILLFCGVLEEDTPGVEQREFDDNDEMIIADDTF